MHHVQIIVYHSLQGPKAHHFKAIRGPALVYKAVEKGPKLTQKLHLPGGLRGLSLPLQVTNQRVDSPQGTS